MRGAGARRAGRSGLGAWVGAAGSRVEWNGGLGAAGNWGETLRLYVYIHNDRWVPHVIAGLAGMRVRIAIFLPASNYPLDSSSCPRPHPRAGNGARIRARRVSYPRVRGYFAHIAIFN
jgi:hypothetical protein